MFNPNPHKLARPTLPGWIVAVLIGAVVIELDTPLGAQIGECRLPETFRQHAPDASNTTRFGNAIGISGNHVVITAPGPSGGGPGEAYVFEMLPDGLSLVQTLANTLPPGNTNFGEAAAMDGNILVVGAPQYDLLCPECGAAYVYRSDGERWVEEALLMESNHVQLVEQFGFAVDVKGDLIAVGAPRQWPTASNNGSVYLFRYAHGAWNLEQTVQPSSSVPAYSNFGRRLALNDAGDMLVVGAVPESNVGNSPVYVFANTGDGWVQQQVIISPQANGDTDFGRGLAIEGSTLVIGAPGDNRAYVYQHDGAAWNLDQTLIGGGGDKFGTAIALNGDDLIITAPTESYQVPACPWGGFSSNSGVIHPHQRRAGEWVATTPFAAYPFAGWEDAVTWLGQSVALANRRAVASTPLDGIVLAFDLDFADCDSNGVPDSCEPDCNVNGVLDSCEIAFGEASDCDANNVPDECDGSWTYVLDDGLADLVFGTPMMPDGRDVICLNHFKVRSGGEYVTHIGAYWSYWTKPGQLVTALLYDDPNNDGDPSDAVLLHSLSFIISVPALSPVHFCMFPDPIAPHPIERTFVGNAGESFFAGFHLSLEADMYGIAGDFTNPDHHRSWRAAAAFGEADIYDLTNNEVPIALNPFNVDYLIRAMSLDCNGNGVFDQCDIDSGFSLDLNANGIPDECDAPCPADINSSGGVDVSDLLMVINAWGPCPQPCSADINASGNVDVNDLLAVINSWGVCP